MKLHEVSIYIYIYITIPTLNFLFWGWYHNLRPERASNLKFLPSLGVYVKLLSTKFQPPSSSGSGVRRGQKVPKWAKTSKLLYLRCWQAGPLFWEKFLGGWDGATFALASAVTQNSEACQAHGMSTYTDEHLKSTTAILNEISWFERWPIKT